MNSRILQGKDLLDSNNYSHNQKKDKYSFVSKTTNKVVLPFLVMTVWIFYDNYQCYKDEPLLHELFLVVPIVIPGHRVPAVPSISL